MPLAWSYQRTSTARQAAADRSGMDRQESALAAWLASHPDYQLAEALIDPGISAGKGKHRTKGALAKFINGGKDGTVPPGSCLVVESWSRFSREVAIDSLATLLNDVWGQGLAISFCTDGVVLTRELINREDHRLHGLIGAIGQARREWEERSRRAQGAVKKRRELQDQGERPPGKTPFWIKRGADGTFSLDPVHSVTVRRAVELAINGYGSFRIANALNEEKRPTASRARSWTDGAVRHLLANPALIGTLARSNGNLMAFYPEVIDRLQHAELLRSLSCRTEKHRTIRGNSKLCLNLFERLSRCSHCDGPISYMAPAKKSRPGHPGYVFCRAALRTSKSTAPDRCPGKGMIEADSWTAHCLTRLSIAVWTELLGGGESDQLVADLQGKERELGSRQLQLQDLLASREAAADELFLANASDERQETANRVISKLKADLAGTSAELLKVQQALAVEQARPSSAQAAEELLAKVSDFYRRLDAASPEERVSFNRWLLSRSPAITFRLDPALRTVELVVGDHSDGVKPLSGHARRMALEAGVVDPLLALDAVGVGATVLTREGKLLTDPGPDAVDPASLDEEERKAFEEGFAQGLEDMRKVLRGEKA